MARLFIGRFFDLIGELFALIGGNFTFIGRNFCGIGDFTSDLIFNGGGFSFIGSICLDIGDFLVLSVSRARKNRRCLVARADIQHK